MAISREALWNKSRVFIEKAIRRRDEEEYAEFQLWAALAMEVLGKAALAHVHPTLVADPNDVESLLVACGIAATAEFKTITAHTTFTRCKRIVKDFDQTCESFCIRMAKDRNAELHSGAIPFDGVDLRSWQTKFWACAKLLAEFQGQSLGTLLGEDEAASAQQIIDDGAHALVAAVQGRISRRRREFDEHDQKAREQLTELAKSQTRWVDTDESKATRVWCPACGAPARLDGFVFDEVLGEHVDNEPWLRWVTRHHEAESLRCVACKLALDGVQELEAAELETEFEKKVTQQSEDDGDYGNE